MMAVFIVATIHPEVDALVKARLNTHFPNDYYEIGRGKWLVSFKGTAQALYTKLSEGDPPAQNKYLTFGMAGYYGVGSRDMWEWIATKLEKTSG
jgi:hypothetical protein